MTEQWRDVVGYEGLYKVSSLGRVYSVPRAVRSRRHTTLRRGRILKPAIIKGYENVRLSDRDGVVKNKRPHRLVLEAFVGSPPSGHVGCHNDGDPLNNKIENLRWDTLKGNRKDMVRHGTSLQGERNPTATLTEDDVRFIRSSSCNLSIRALAKKFGVARNTIFYAKTGVTWKHLDAEVRHG